MVESYDENLILGYVEGDLAPQDRAAFERQLEGDARLRALVEQLLHDRAALRAWPDEVAPPEVMTQVNQRLEREMLLEPLGRSDTIPIRRHRIVRYVLYGAVAALVVVSTGVVVRTLIPNGPAGSPSGPRTPGNGGVAKSGGAGGPQLAINDQKAPELPGGALNQVQDAAGNSREGGSRAVASAANGQPAEGNPGAAVAARPLAADVQRAANGGVPTAAGGTAGAQPKDGASAYEIEAAPGVPMPGAPAVAPPAPAASPIAPQALMALPRQVENPGLEQQNALAREHDGADSQTGGWCLTVASANVGQSQVGLLDYCTQNHIAIVPAMGGGAAAKVSAHAPGYRLGDEAGAAATAPANLALAQAPGGRDGDEKLKEDPSVRLMRIEVPEDQLPKLVAYLNSQAGQSAGLVQLTPGPAPGITPATASGVAAAPAAGGSASSGAVTRGTGPSTQPSMAFRYDAGRAPGTTVSGMRSGPQRVQAKPEVEALARRLMKDADRGRDKATAGKLSLPVILYQNAAVEQK